MHRVQIFLFAALLISPDIFAQSGPLRFSSPFEVEIRDSIRVSFDTHIPDTSSVSFAVIRFRIIREKVKSSFYLALSNAGGLVAFGDSLFREPLRLEKRSVFPFRRPLHGRIYRLLFTCRPGAGDYFGFRLTEDNQRMEIVDEVLWCSPESRSALEFSSYQGWTKAR